VASVIVYSDTIRIKELLFRVLGVYDYAKLERMGGLTNRTYKVSLLDGRVFVVRLPGEGTESLIDRDFEKVSTMLACSLDIDTQLLYFSQNGEKVSAYIEGAVTMSPQLLQQPQNLVKAAQLLHKLHTCNQDTGVPFDVFNMATSYESIIGHHCIPLYEDYTATKAKVFALKKEIDLSPTPLVPCHNDPLCENWVLSGNGRMYLIDWEYAGMNDNMWDLADVSIEASLTPDQEEILLTAYFNRVPFPEERKRFFANKIYLDFLWTLWGKARVPFDGEPMEVYAAERYARLKENLSYFTKYHKRK
jgi:thiamine kinase-like enzyme